MTSDSTGSGTNSSHGQFELTPVMDSLALLQQWYLQQCNEDWEHSWGVRIATLDNPG